MSDYIPTTEEVRQLYVDATRELLARDMYLDEIQAEFDRWLAEHDREKQAQVWEEGYVAGAVSIIAGAPLNPYRQGEEQ